MRQFLNYLRGHPGCGLQMFVVGPDGQTTSKIVDVLEFNEIGLTVANRSNGSSGTLEAYPWSAVQGLVTTLNANATFQTMSEWAASSE